MVYNSRQHECSRNDWMVSNMIKWIGSPNYSERRGQIPFAIIFHIMDGTLAGTDSWLQNKSSGVSYHYGLGNRGEIHQYVQEEFAAWHAGKVDNPTWKHYGGINPNWITIGIALEGRPGDPVSEEMFNSLLSLTADIVTRRRIEVNREYLVGHYEIRTPARANCPGPAFPWNKLLQELASPTAEIATIPKWKAEGLAWLQENGLIDDTWQATDPLDIGSFGKILSRLTVTGRK